MQYFFDIDGHILRKPAVTPKEIFLIYTHRFVLGGIVS
jgi:hypothetical protein